MTAEVFKDRVLRHSADMWRMAVSILRDSDAAKDAVQEALSRLWENRDRLIDIDNARPYCMMAVRNVAIDLCRRRDFLSVGPIDEAYPLPSRDRDPEQLLQGAQKVEMVERLIDSLPPNQQTVIRMSCIGGCDIAEIRQATGLSAENVRVLLSRARRKLKELYQLMAETDKY